MKKERRTKSMAFEEWLRKQLNNEYADPNDLSEEEYEEWYSMWLEE